MQLTIQQILYRLKKAAKNNSDIVYVGKRFFVIRNEKAYDELCKCADGYGLSWELFHCANSIAGPVYKLIEIVR